MFFKTRKLAREFATKNERYTFDDRGADAPKGQRWHVAVV